MRQRSGCSDVPCSPPCRARALAYLRREAAVVFDHDDLMARARIWLVEHHYLLLRERDIRRQVIVARRHHEQALFKTIAAAVPAAERETWVSRLLAPVEGGEMGHVEWLGAVPSSKGAKGLEEQIEKVGFLKDWPRTGSSSRSAARRAGAFRQTADVAQAPRRWRGSRTRIGRLRSPASCASPCCVTDASLTLLDHRIAALWRDARERAAEARASRLRRSVNCSAISRGWRVTKRSRSPNCGRGCAA